MKRKMKRIFCVILAAAMMLAMTVSVQAARSDSFIMLYYGYHYSGTLDIGESGAWRVARATITSEELISNETSDSVSLHGLVKNMAGQTLGYLDAQKEAISNITSASDSFEHSELQNATVDYHAGYYLSSPVIKTLSVSR